MAGRDIVAFAREYDSFGWALVALPEGSKRPVTTGWQTALASPEDFQQLVDDGLYPTVGMMCGQPSNSVCRVDLDHPVAVRIARMALPETGLVMGRDGNPRSGYFYRVTDGLQSSISYKDPAAQGDEATIIDLLWTGKMTVLPPSRHPSGGFYGWHEFKGAAEVTSDLLLATLEILFTASLVAIHWPDGARHDAVMALAGGLASEGWSHERIEGFVRLVCLGAEDEEVDDRLRAVADTFEAIQQDRNTVGWTRLQDSVDRRVIRRVREVLGLIRQARTARTASAVDLRTSDMGNAERMVAQYANTLRFCHPMKKWFHWTGAKWQEDQEAIAGRSALEVVRSIYIEAANADTRDKRQSLSEWALNSERASLIASMISIARTMPEMVVLPQEMDTNIWLLNTPNGTVDLQANKLMNHDQGDLITKATMVPWNPEATCPQWLRFLDEVFDGDQEVIDYIQKVAGYCLTGTTREQALFVCWGDGANGKSTFLYVMEKILGDYAANTPFETFDATKHSLTGNELARLKGKRFVTAIEAEQERYLAEARVKAITGGDKITCRFLYGEFFEYYPEYKIMLAVNYKPIIRGTDHGIWRRIVLIPFIMSFKGKADIKGLKEKMVAEEAEGIFAWMMDGVPRYVHGGLEPPAKLTEATQQYRSEMDVMAQFLEECTERDDSTYALAKDLYTRYQYWVKDYGERLLSHRSFGLELSRRGYLKKKGNSQIRWAGLKLRPEVFSPAGMVKHEVN